MAHIMFQLGQMNAVTPVLNVLVRNFIVFKQIFWVERILIKHIFGYIYEMRTRHLNAVK